MRPTISAPPLASAIALGLVTAACGADPDVAAAPDAAIVCTGARAWISVPVRIQLIQSDDATFTAHASAAEVAAVVDAADGLWAQACVRFAIESTVVAPTDPALVAAYRDALASHDLMTVSRALGALLPDAAALDPGVNVYVFGGLGMPRLGRYFSNLDAVAWADQKPDGEPTQPVLLAHELGHALALEHYTGDDPEHNLMTASGGDPTLMTQLTAEQIDAARAQAATGDAW
jgi:hypothetical protein